MRSLIKKNSWFDRTFGCSSIGSAEVMAIIVPMVVDRIIISLISMVNTAMLSSSGPEIIVASGIVGSLHSIIFCLITSITVGGSIIISQLKGKEDHIGVSRAVGQTFALSITFSFILAFFLMIAGRPALSFFYPTMSEAVIDNAYFYLFGLCISYPLTTLIEAAFASLRGLGDGKACLFVSVSGSVINLVCSYVFIVAMKLSILGVIISTLIIGIYKVIFLYFLLVKGHGELQLKFKSFLVFDKDMIGKMVKITIPFTLENLFFSAGNFVQSTFTGRIGEIAIRMGTIASSMLTLPETLMISLESAVPPIVGRCVGAGKPKEAKKMTYVCIGIALALGSGCLLVISPFYSIIVKTYSPTPEMMGMLPILFFSYGIMRCLFGPTSTSAAAALRASGDAAYATVGAMVSMWCVKIVLGYILGIQLGGGILGLWIASYSEWVVRSIFFVSRIHSKHWCKKKLV